MEELLNCSVPEEEGGAVLRSPKNIARRKTGLRQTESFGLLNPDDDLVSSSRKQLKKNIPTVSLRTCSVTRPSQVDSPPGRLAESRRLGC